MALVRTLSGVPLAAGFIALLLGLTTGRRGAGLQSIAATAGAQSVSYVEPRLAVAMRSSEGM